MTAVPGLQGLVKAGIRVFLFPDYEIVQQRYAYLLNLNENTPGRFICLTSCTAGSHVNRHRDYLSTPTGSVLLIMWVISLRSRQDCYLQLAIIDLS